MIETIYANENSDYLNEKLQVVRTGTQINVSALHILEKLRKGFFVSTYA